VDLDVARGDGGSNSGGFTSNQIGNVNAVGVPRRDTPPADEPTPRHDDPNIRSGGSFGG
jgi:hypothetical protein